MESEGNNKNAENRGYKKGTDDYDNEISVGSVGNENTQDNGASTLRELRKKYADKMPLSSKPRKPML